MVNDGPEVAGTPLNAVLRRGAQRLADSGIESPAEDMRRLLSHALGLDRTALMRQADRLLTGENLLAIEALVVARLAGKPVARIEGQRGFYGRMFALSDETLEPRADSEIVVETALSLCPGAERVLDIGTGTGCLLLSLLAELPNALGLGTDISHGALVTAQGNAARLGLTDRARFLAADGLGGALAAVGDGAVDDLGLRDQPFDLVVANPPYIATAVIASLAREVRLHDPLIALDGGADGLDNFRAFCIALDSPVRHSLSNRAAIVLEIGYDQASAVKQLLHSVAAVDPETIEHRLDLGQNLRLVACRLRGPLASRL